MAKVVVEIDTVEKTGKILVDGVDVGADSYFVHKRRDYDSNEVDIIIEYTVEIERPDGLGIERKTFFIPTDEEEAVADDRGFAVKDSGTNSNAESVAKFLFYK